LKILVCSPSNGGCDELARRLKREIDKNNLHFDDKEFALVRIGRPESIHKDCESIMFEELVRKKSINLAHLQRSGSLSNHYETLKTTEKNFKNKIEIAKNSSNTNMMREHEDNLNEVLKKKKNLEIQLKKLNSNSNNDPKKDAYRCKEIVLKEASIIISTLSFSGNPILDCLGSERNEGKPAINAILIDEASQCLEVDCLIPLRFGCNKLILVGDPEQLPATVLSKVSKFLYFCLQYICFYF
jgi:senataxin